MKFNPYPFQRAAIDHAVDFLRSAKAGQRQLYAAPTGTGKSVVELAVQQQLPGFLIVTPRDEIADGMVDKGGDPSAICTPIKLRNRLLKGEVAPPAGLIIDESHHSEAETWQQLDLLSGCAPMVGYTATPYRGSPRSTRSFREYWGDPLWLISYEEAVAMGYISMPQFAMLPLVDDDIVEVQGGEFSVTSIDSATVDRLGDLAEHSRQWHRGGLWDKPTVFACPSSSCCVRLQQELAKRGMPAAIVNSGTPKADRRGTFEHVVKRTVALLHINIVTEGVDLPIRRLVDLAPTLSPVKWVQQLGRATRPSKDCQPEYVCTNRNVLRHAYALQGAVPFGAVTEAEKAFPAAQRAHTRVLGLEAIGRFKPASAVLVSGGRAYVYSLSVAVPSPTGGAVVVEYCCIVHPALEPIWASKVNQRDGDQVVYGKWTACEPPSDLSGFGSVSASAPSPKQLAWWQRGAGRFGLEPDQEVNRRNFQVLPVLCDIGARLP